MADVAIDKPEADRPCRCGHERSQHCGPGAPATACLQCSCGQYLPRKPRRCKGCADGLATLMLDDDGVRTDISGRPGVPSHAVEEYYWPCTKWTDGTQPPSGLRGDPVAPRTVHADTRGSASSSED